MDNLLREYAGSHHDYDERGNQIRRWHNGQQSRLHWDLFDRLVRFENSQLSVDYAYDPLGRRLYKHSNAHHLNRSEAGSQWNRNEQARKQRELGCGFTLFGWDGDTLAWESSPAQADGASGKTVHYLYQSAPSSPWPRLYATNRCACWPNRVTKVPTTSTRTRCGPTPRKHCRSTYWQLRGDGFAGLC